MPKHPLYRYGVRFTEAQRDIIQAFAKERGLERPQDILQALAQEYFGDQWPTDYPEWGVGRRKQKDEAGK